MAGRTNKINMNQRSVAKSASMPTNNDFLKPLLDLMQKNAERQDERMDTIEAKIEKNTEVTNQIHTQTLKTNGRVNRHDEEIKEIKLTLEKLHPREMVKKNNLELWYRDPLLLKVVLYILLLAIILVGAILGINVKDIL